MKQILSNSLENGQTVFFYFSLAFGCRWFKMAASHLALFKFGLLLINLTSNLKSSCIHGKVNSSKLCLNDNLWFNKKIKLKLSKRLCLYDSNSSACQRLLLNDGDISPNRGPAPKCEACSKPVRVNQAKVNCNMCFNINYLKCTDPK